MMLDETEASRGKLAVSREEFFADYDTPNKISIAVANECFDILVDLKPLTIITNPVVALLFLIIRSRCITFSMRVGIIELTMV